MAYLNLADITDAAVQPEPEMAQGAEEVDGQAGCECVLIASAALRRQACVGNHLLTQLQFAR
jgi:hypothetical protein